MRDTPSVDDQMDIDSNENMDLASPSSPTSGSPGLPSPKASKHPFLADLQGELVADAPTTEHKWTIKGYSALREKAMASPEHAKVFSPEFCLNGEWWRLLLFPNGNDTDSLSLYFEYLAAKNTDKPNWHRCAQFAIKISNCSDESIAIHKGTATCFGTHAMAELEEANHRFCAEAVDWGFTQFHRIALLTVPVEKSGKCLLENDSFDITVYVRTIRDSTGTLWHTFSNWDSRKETGYIGLKNQGATCYMNSLLQSLYFTSNFRKALFQIPTDNDEATKSVALALQRLFYSLQNSEYAADTRELTKSFGWDTMDAFMQHDIQEFNRVLQDNLETKMKGTKAEGAIEKLFVGKMKSYIKCVNVEYESSREEAFYDIQLNVKGRANLYESFKDYIDVEMLDGENKYRAENFGLQDAKKGVIFTKFPPVLHLQLKRFEYDFQRDAMVKINDRHEFPLEIDLSEFLEESERPKYPAQKYHLHGVLVHSGDVHGGHYCAFLRPEQNNKWFKFDDDRVTPVTEKEALDENYGDSSQMGAGLLTPGTPPLQVRRLQAIKRFTNAYMLVYIRDSDRADVLSPVTEKDLPAHLTQNLNLEKLKREKLASEAAEKHLYFNVHLVRDSDITSHQGFDLFNSEDREQCLTVKARKDLPFKDFTALVGSTINVEPEKIRFWNFYRRQNKTLRPEAPLPVEKLQNEPLEKIYAASSQIHNEFRLYVDLATHRVQDSHGKITFFPDLSPEILVLFIKFYDPEKQELQFVGKLRVKSNLKGSDLVQLMVELKGLPPNTPIRAFEEVKPSMIVPLKLKQTLKESEFLTGDIITFQKELTKEQEKLAMSSVVSYYEYLQWKVVVEFRPKRKETDNNKAPEPLRITLSKRMTYDDIVTKLGKEINEDPFMIRLSINPSGGDVPKHVLKRTPGQTLHEILQTSFYSPLNPVFWFEKSDISITELETKRVINVTLVDATLKEKESVDVLVAKTGTVADLLRALQTTHPNAVRLFDVEHGKVLKPLAVTGAIGTLGEFYSQIFAEIDKVEDVVADAHEKLVTVYHFHRDPQHTHSVPFQVVMKPGMTVEALKKKVATRMNLAEKDMSKIKFSVVGFGNRVRYLEDDAEILGDSWESTDFIGLDHVDKNAARKAGGFEKAIKIHN